jgi:hypothetical protein
MSYIFRSLFAIDSNTNLPIPAQYILTTDGQGGLNWQNIFTNINTVSPEIGYLPSTINGFSNSIINLSTLVVNSAIPGSIAGPQLYSTANGLGSLGFVSSSQLTSSLQGLGSLGYLSTSGVQQIVTTTLNSFYQYASISTSVGLGTLGYVSSAQMASTVSGLSNAGYINYPNLRSTITSLGTFGYLSSLSLQSTYNSLKSLTQTVQNSTLQGLGSYGYISSLSLQSTITNILRVVQVNAAGSIVINSGANVYISTLGSIAYTSNFYNSSITYRGTNGLTTASTTGNDFFFSTAALQLEGFSNYINSNTQFTADIYPNFLFCPAYPRNVPQTLLLPMSTFLSYQGHPILSTTITSLLILNSFNDGQSNYFQAPLRMRFSGQQININSSNYVEEYVLHHRIPSAYANGLTPGLANSNILIYMASTNSVYLTIQNTSV